MTNKREFHNIRTRLPFSSIKFFEEIFLRTTFVIKLLPFKSRLKLVLLSTIQIILNGVDMVAIALTGFIVTMSISELQGDSYPKLAMKLFEVLGTQDWRFQSKLVLLSILALFLFAIKSLVGILLTRENLKFLSRESAEVSRKTLKSIYDKGYSFIVNHRSQDLLIGAVQGPNALILNFVGSLNIFIVDFILLVSVTVGLTLYNQPLGISFFVYFLLAFLITQRIMLKASSSTGKESSKEFANLNREILESFSMFRENTLVGGMSKTLSSIVETRIRFTDIQARIQFIPQLNKYLMEFTIVGGAFFIAGVQVLLFDAKTAVTSIVVFIASSSRAVPSILRIQTALYNMKVALGISSQTLELLDSREAEMRLDSPTRVERQVILREGKNFLPTVEIRSLSFTYPNASNYALKNITLKISQGSKIAIVGETGSGKSTLANLVLGFLVPNKGEVLISGVSSRDAIRAWPKHVAFVPQEIVIKSSSLAENISLAPLAETNLKDVEAALREVKFDALKELEIDLRTNLGESGRRLSGGQRQKIALARLIYQQPSLIILDEATSSLDNLSEDTISRKISDLFKQSTILVIAHRLSTIKNADSLVYLEKGQIIAEGDFEYLRRKVEKFNKLVELGSL